MVAEVTAFLRDRARAATEAGIAEVWIDPGIGFGKTARHNLQLLAALDDLVGVGYPVLVGKLALPILCAMSLSPYLGALALQHGGVKATLVFVSGLALLNVALVFVLLTLTRGKRVEGAA